jgi:hypothetical protein
VGSRTLSFSSDTAGYDLAELQAKGVAKLLPGRFIDMLLGCAMALFGTVVALPRAALADGTAEDPKDRLAVDRDDGPN